MKLIVDIPYEIYKDYMTDRIKTTEVLQAVRHGTPLSKHHERIIDEAKINTIYTHTDFVDTPNTIETSRNYKPTCPRGYEDCVYDPAYVKYNHPEWYAKLYGSLSVEEASNQSCRLSVEDDPDEEYECYDDEDK